MPARRITHLRTWITVPRTTGMACVGAVRYGHVCTSWQRLRSDGLRTGSRSAGDTRMGAACRGVAHPAQHRGGSRLQLQPGVHRPAPGDSAQLEALKLHMHGLSLRKASQCSTAAEVARLLVTGAHKQLVMLCQVASDGSTLLSGPYAMANGSHQQASGSRLHESSSLSQRLLLPAVVALTPSPQTLTHAVLSEQQQQPASGQQQPRKSLHLQRWEAEQIHYQQQRLWQQQLDSPTRRSQRLSSSSAAQPSPQPQQQQQRWQQDRQQSGQPLVQSASVTARYPVRACTEPSGLYEPTVTQRMCSRVSRHTWQPSSTSSEVVRNE